MKTHSLHYKATSYSGAVVRTTHMTGICTDIGNILGQACRKDSKAELWKLKVFVPILLSFMFGGFLGQACYLLMHENAILLPCFFTGGMGVLYLSLPFVKRAGKTLAEITAFEKANGVELTTKGDPSKVKPDYFQAILGKDVDLEVKNFMAELDQPTVKVVDQEKPDLAESRKTSFISKLKSSSNKSKDIELHTAKNGATFNQFLADAEDESFANLIAETVPAQPSDHKMFS